MAEKTLEEQARALIWQQGYSISKDYALRILAPDADGDREVLFRGRWKGDERAKIGADTEDCCYALIWRGEGTSYVGSGW